MESAYANDFSHATRTEGKFDFVFYFFLEGYLFVPLCLGNCRGFVVTGGYNPDTWASQVLSTRNWHKIRVQGTRFFYIYICFLQERVRPSAKALPFWNLFVMRNAKRCGLYNALIVRLHRTQHSLSDIRVHMGTQSKR